MDKVDSDEKCSSGRWTPAVGETEALALMADGDEGDDADDAGAK